MRKKKAFPLDRYLMGCFRKVFGWYPPRRYVKESSRRGKEQYECGLCKGLFRRSEIVVDHVEPVIDPMEGFKGYDVLFKRMFCLPSNLMAVCRPCHLTKTNEENKIRRKIRKDRKKDV